VFFHTASGNGNRGDAATLEEKFAAFEEFLDTFAAQH